MTTLEIQRLERLAPGDLEAARILAGEYARRGDHDALRRIAWAQIESGATPAVVVNGRPILPGRDFVPDFCGEADPDDPDAERILTSPLRVPLLWDPARARLFACDCAEHVLPFFERAYRGNGRPHQALKRARAHAHGEADGRALADLARTLNRAVDEIAADRTRLQGAWQVMATVAACCGARPCIAADRAMWVVSAAAWDPKNEDIERRWQQQRLLQYLLGVLPLAPKAEQ